ncbi:MAG TPA: hypothetical protein VJ302_28485 [Blastocatellia bacterium]|nr:hypothetical protein [Blastocatellia bacterium]
MNARLNVLHLTALPDDLRDGRLFSIRIMPAHHCRLPPYSLAQAPAV